ncbi:hypothetical protein L2E82_16686 [Cichorium intybus]|uniref:Uncharacterized protein n=1 Tax=Cichorium intybus TaxID=13427 RepID=A0ACB9F6U4_CICIN|nr:hypothetical protein L2E82_16686 [Cichorium intybus]
MTNTTRVGAITDNGVVIHRHFTRANCLCITTPLSVIATLHCKSNSRRSAGKVYAVYETNFILQEYRSNHSGFWKKRLKKGQRNLLHLEEVFQLVFECQRLYRENECRQDDREINAKYGQSLMQRMTEKFSEDAVVKYG